MSDLLKTFAAYLRTIAGADVRVVVDYGSPNDDALAATAEYKTVKSDLEGRALDGVPVGDAETGRIRYFCDGIQRPCGPIYIDSPVPILYGYTAAAIRARGDDRKMHIVGGAHAVDESLYMPHRLFDDGGLRRAGIGVVDTCDAEEPEHHPLKLLEIAKKKVSGRRERLESELVTEWLRGHSSSAEWLLVDGSISGDYGGLEPRNLIGVIKSHQTQYFEWDEQCKVLALRVGERSGVFIPGGRKRHEVYSWYLRLHSNDGKDPYFGLVRVEAAKSDRTLEIVDELCRWLMAERCPVSLPDSRWDRMLYPIYDCEQYLKSLAPTRAVLNGMLASLASA
jgi:hypothetical protein